MPSTRRLFADALWSRDLPGARLVLALCCGALAALLAAISIGLIGQVSVLLIVALTGASVLAAFLSLALCFVILWRMVFIAQDGGGWWLLLDTLRRNVREFDAILSNLEKDAGETEEERRTLAQDRLREVKEELDTHVVRYFVLRRVRVFLLLVFCGTVSLGAFSALYLVAASTEQMRSDAVAGETPTTEVIRAITHAAVNFVMIGIDPQDTTALRTVLILEAFFVNFVLVTGLGLAFGLDGSLLLMNPDNVGKALDRYFL